MERVQRHVKIRRIVLQLLFHDSRFLIYAIIGHLHRAVIIGRGASWVGRYAFSSRLVESPDAEWVGELKNRYVRKWESPAVPPSFFFFTFHVLFLLAVCFIHVARVAQCRDSSDFFQFFFFFSFSFFSHPFKFGRNSRKRGETRRKRGKNLSREDTLRWFVNFAGNYVLKKKRETGSKRGGVFGI